jgi:hypothetical protein
VLIELVKQLIKSAGDFPLPLLVATGDELPKPIYEALLCAMPLGPFCVAAISVRPDQSCAS